MARGVMSDILLRAMKAAGIPLTRRNYLTIAHLGRPYRLSAEEEACLPDFEALRVEQVVVNWRGERLTIDLEAK
jgi:hypothetical protein